MSEQDSQENQEDVTQTQEVTVADTKESISKLAEGKNTQKEIEQTTADYYFDSYSHFGIHEEMLKDEVRTRTYMRSILNNRHLFRGKTVLDVGCGTGILCMFAARAGAAKVIGVECAGIYEQAVKIVAANNLNDVITLIKGKVEEIELPVDKVDIIISEWMGYFLIYESMLDTVIYARDKWLVDGGMLFPDKAQLYLLGIEDQDYRDEKINFWDNVYGFDMTPIKTLALLEPLVDTCDPKQVISNACKVLDVDLYTCTKPDLDFDSQWEIKISRRDLCHAVVAFFNVQFSKSHRPLGFSTGPFADYTHWKQTVFYINEPIPAEEGDNIHGRITVGRNQRNPRDIDITMRYGINGGEETEQFYRLR
jgi:protein arginine N-methyltransferase 1